MRIELRRYFEAADGRRSYWATQKKLFAKRREETERREKFESESDADITAFAAGSAIATNTQIKAFETKLDTYGTATVEALMANDKAMENVRARLDALLDQAFVIEDGRRVFTTRDGTQVFDEFGEELDHDLIAPEEIDDIHPYWEDYAPVFAEKQALEAERAEILEYQQRLDDARDTVSESNLTTEELEAMDAELAELMPSAVAQASPTQRSEFDLRVQVQSQKSTFRVSELAPTDP